jgi:hypothetical protein
MKKGNNKLDTLKERRDDDYLISRSFITYFSYCTYSQINLSENMIIIMKIAFEL